MVKVCVLSYEGLECNSMVDPVVYYCCFFVVCFQIGFTCVFTNSNLLIVALDSFGLRLIYVWPMNP
jgi:hypothetical protein